MKSRSQIKKSATLFAVLITPIASGMELHQAAQSGNLYVVQKELDRGINVQTIDQDSSTLLHHAVARQAMADEQRHYTVIGQPSLFDTSRKNLTQQGAQLIDFLIFPEREIWRINLFPKQTVRALLAANADSCAIDGNGRTPLHVAAEHGNHDGVRMLLEAGAEMDGEGTRYQNPPSPLLVITRRFRCTMRRFARYLDQLSQQLATATFPPR